jgi:HEAT repeat protein
MLSAASLGGAALFVWWLLREPDLPDGHAVSSVVKATEPVPQRATGSATSGEVLTLTAEEAAALSAADLSLKLAAWPEGQATHRLPEFARLLAARGPGAVHDIASALATAGSNSARGVLADALALIGSAEAVQELCTAAVKVPAGAERAAIATAFRTLSQPEAVPVLASVFNQTSEPQLTAEAGAAIQRLADARGVLALVELMNEDGQLHSQREALLLVLSGIQSPAARPALEALAADQTDPERAAAAAKALRK